MEDRYTHAFKLHGPLPAVPSGEFVLLIGSLVTSSFPFQRRCAVVCCAQVAMQWQCHCVQSA